MTAHTELLRMAAPVRCRWCGHTITTAVARYQGAARTLHCGCGGRLGR